MPDSNKHRRHSDKKAAPHGSFITEVPIVLLSMILSGLLLLTLFTYFSLKSESPILLSDPLSLLALYLCSLTSGMLCTLRLKSPDSYFCAILSSSAFVLILIIMKFIIPGNNSGHSAGLMILLHLLVVLTSVIGAFIGEKRKANRTGRRKSRR